MHVLKLISLICLISGYLLFGMGAMFIYTIFAPHLAFLFLVFASIFVLLSGYYWQAYKRLSQSS